MSYQHNDGGRAAAGFRGTASDCVARAIAIAAEMPYKQAYKLVGASAYHANLKRGRKVSGKSSPRTGVQKTLTRRIFEALGWTWMPTMGIGTGCTAHLRAEELPRGRIVASVSRHVVAVIDGVINDTHDPSRNGTRCVYGYWRLAKAGE